MSTVCTRKLRRSFELLNIFQANLDKLRWFQWRTGKSKKKFGVSGTELGGEGDEMSWQFVI
jgi:hypothetical protein